MDTSAPLSPVNSYWTLPLALAIARMSLHIQSSRLIPIEKWHLRARVDAKTGDLSALAALSVFVLRFVVFNYDAPTEIWEIKDAPFCSPLSRLNV